MTGDNPKSLPDTRRCTFIWYLAGFKGHVLHRTSPTPGQRCKSADAVATATATPQQLSGRAETLLNATPGIRIPVYTDSVASVEVSWLLTAGVQIVARCALLRPVQANYSHEEATSTFDASTPA